MATYRCKEFHSVSSRLVCVKSMCKSTLWCLRRRTAQPSALPCRSPWARCANNDVAERTSSPRLGFGLILCGLSIGAAHLLLPYFPPTLSFFFPILSKRQVAKFRYASTKEHRRLLYQLACGFRPSMLSLPSDSLQMLDCISMSWRQTYDEAIRNTNFHEFWSNCNVPWIPCQAPPFQPLVYECTYIGCVLSS